MVLDIRCVSFFGVDVDVGDEQSKDAGGDFVYRLWEMLNFYCLFDDQCFQRLITSECFAPTCSSVSHVITYMSSLLEQ